MKPITYSFLQVPKCPVRLTHTSDLSLSIQTKQPEEGFPVGTIERIAVPPPLSESVMLGKSTLMELAYHAEPSMSQAQLFLISLPF